MSPPLSRTEPPAPREKLRSHWFEELRGVVAGRVDRGSDFVGFEVRFRGHYHVVERGKLGECGVSTPILSHKGHRYPVEIINH